MNAVAIKRSADHGAVKERLLITCVSPERPHPSGRLAARFATEGYDVHHLFENARSPGAIFADAKRLADLLTRTPCREVMINVNGSVAQAVAVALARRRGISTTLWIMDSYPGCLRYVTAMWWLLYPLFYIASVIAKTGATRVLAIDEAFVEHAPTWRGFRQKCIYTPLPQMPVDRQLTEREIADGAVDIGPAIGVIGNIERHWVRRDFPAFYRAARRHGYRVLVATSHSVDRDAFALDGVECIIPWPKEETERVFASCDAILVPLSTPRLIYSSPSKIIDCYLRGIQPVVMTDRAAWERNSNRWIYGKCIHIDDFFSGRTTYAPQELADYGAQWLTAGQTVGVV